MHVETDSPPDSLELVEADNKARVVDAMTDRLVGGRAAHGCPLER